MALCGTTPGVIGKSVAIPVGVNSSAPSWVGVGVKVRGVLVEVANRFWVGAGVMRGLGVGVSAAGRAVGVMISCARSDSDAQLERRIESRKTYNFFFMERIPFANDCDANKNCTLRIQDLAMRQRHFRPGHNRAPQHLTRNGGGDQLVLEPCIFKITIPMNLI